MLFIIQIALSCAIVALAAACGQGDTPSATAASALALANAAIAGALLYKKKNGTAGGQLERALRSFDIEGFFLDPSGQEQAPEELLRFVNDFVIQANQYYSALEYSEKQSEYAVLQSQINPHFLYNTLEAIRSEALLAGHSDIADMTENLSRFFRYSISQTGDFVTIQNELYNINDYLSIQQFRFGDKFSLETIIEDESALRCRLPKLTFQPIVENAIFHGLEQIVENGLITIRITKTAKKVVVLISDNGRGMPQEKVVALNRSLLGQAPPVQAEVKRTSGIALRNVNQRLRLYFGSEYGLHVNSILNVGTDVEMVLPFMDDLEFLQHTQAKA